MGGAGRTSRPKPQDIGVDWTRSDADAIRGVDSARTAPTTSRLTDITQRAECRRDMDGRHCGAGRTGLDCTHQRRSGAV